MARHRRLRAAPKLLKRPIADALLGPLARLPLAPDMADEIAMRWAALGPVGHQRFAAGHADHASMLADTQRHVARVREHARCSDFRARVLADMARTAAADNVADEYATDLVALVRGDPRYLASDLVVGTVLLWKLLVIRGLQHARRGTKRAVVAERARKYLGDLADAASGLAVVTGRGRQEFIDPIVLLADYEHHVDVVCDVVASIESGKHNDEIADATKLSSERIAEIRKRPRAVKGHAEQLTLDLYGHPFEVDRLRRHLREARDALNEQPGEVDDAPPPLGSP
jgi:hypothetical protein